MRPSDSRRSVAARAGSLRFLGFSFPARCLQSPRGACRLRSSVASPAVAGVAISGRLAAPKKCNEAESSSLALRLTGSPPRASPWGLLLSVPDWLHVGHSFDMLITFQINREARLGLTHQNTRKQRRIAAVTVPHPIDDNCIGISLVLFRAFRVFRGHPFSFLGKLQVLRRSHPSSNDVKASSSFGVPAVTRLSRVFG